MSSTTLNMQRELGISALPHSQKYSLVFKLTIHICAALAETVTSGTSPFLDAEGLMQQHMNHADTDHRSQKERENKLFQPTDMKEQTQSKTKSLQHILPERVQTAETN